MEDFSRIEALVLDNLKPIFPNHSDEDMVNCVKNPNNHHDPLNEATLLNRCIDELLMQQEEVHLMDLVEENPSAAPGLQATIDLVSPSPEKSTPFRPWVIDGGFVGDDNFEGVANSVTIEKSGAITVHDPAPNTSSVQSEDFPNMSRVRRRANRANRFGSPKASSSSLDQASSSTTNSSPPTVNLTETSPFSSSSSLSPTEAAPQPSCSRNTSSSSTDSLTEAEPQPALTHPPPEPAALSDEEIFNNDVTLVSELFPTIDVDYIKVQLLAYREDRIPLLCNYILENMSSCPRKQKPETASTSSDQQKEEEEASSSPSAAASANYYTDVSIPSRCLHYCDQALHLLCNQYNRISKNDLRTVFRKLKNRYAPTHQAFAEALLKADFLKVMPSSSGSSDDIVPSAVATGDAGILNMEIGSFRTSIPANANIEVLLKIDGQEHKHNFKLLKNKRGRQGLQNFSTINEDLRKELKFMREFNRKKFEEKDAAIASSLNEAEYEEEGQGIMCGCCFTEYSFEKMVQCHEGHLFCESCLRGYANEAVFGQGKIALKCMTDGCDASYPKSQLTKALPKEMLDKYEDRCQEEAINLADMEDLVRCPSCDFAAMLPPDNKVFQCQNPRCGKESCRHCKEDWAEHIGIPCKELEKKDETKLRLAYEEKMTQAKVRTCFKCKAAFTKSDGCNKMTCRCGAKMCYICRKPNIEYNHFCQHPRDPGHDCKKCTACSLWSNPDEDEKRAIQEIQKEAETERIKQGYTGSKAVVGAPDEVPPTKKARKH